MLNIISQAPVNMQCSLGLYTHGMSIGARFRQLRQSNQLTQDAIGSLCEVSKGMVSQWESDDGIPSSERIMLLRKRLHFSVDWLLTGEGEMVDGLYVQDEKLKRALQLLQELPDYAVDQAVKDIASITELVKKASGTHG